MGFITKAIGNTIVDERHENTTDCFWFAIKPKVIVNAFDFVTVKKSLGGKTVGMVKELHAMQSTSNANGEIVARVSPMANAGTSDIGKKNIHIEVPVGDNKPVFFSNKSEIRLALGAPEMKTPIPAGLIEMSNGLQVPISFDTSYLLGPDTAHINASGISGNSKTSYLLFLLQSIYQKLYENTALVIFNTKTDDLLHLHEGRAIDKGRTALYSLLGIDPKPLKSVKYLLPRGSDGKPNSVFVPKGAKTYSFELKDVYADLDMLFLQQLGPSTQGAYGGSHHDVASIVNYISEAWPNLGQNRETGSISSWTDLVQFDDYPTEIVAHKSSFLQFLGQLHRIKRSSLFVDSKTTSAYLGDLIREISPGDVMLIDIAMVSSIEEQSFVVGNVMKTINDLYSYREKPDGARGKRKRKPQNIIIFLDEINRFVPRLDVRPVSPVADQVIQTLVTGRSRRTILFSAQQFKSTVHPSLDENTGMHVIAKLGLSELANANYSMLDQNTKMSITRLTKGEMVMVHPAYRQPVRIVFPKSSLKP